MRLSLPTARQNEVHMGWRRAGHLLGMPGLWEAQNEIHRPSLAHNGPAGRMGRMGVAGGQTRHKMRFIERELARESAGCMQERHVQARFKLARETGEARGRNEVHPPKVLEAPQSGETSGEHGACAWANEVQTHAGVKHTERRAHAGYQPSQTRFIRPGSPPKLELRLLLKVIMADQSEITLGVGVAPMSVGHEGGKRKGRGKSRDPSRAKEDLGDLQKRLAKVKLHLVDGEEKFEEMDTRLVELDGRMK
ncbi:hypothetical protein GH714_012847 [Hevea brasiliensis]|uniref:Uncharacterized protein n=1 Tax=Hevea brasiliensis TaxID=3981 RepID=A0A6A6L1J2_HEVBR|nr:hypothetical protein GH714_012847 [Hevea brasiliensis]